MIFDFSDSVHRQALNERILRSQVISSNIVNSETPGFRALGYDFEKQLQSISDRSNLERLKTSDHRHMKSASVGADGNIEADVYVRPSESVGNDGNSVDMDTEMMLFSKNQILYRAGVELLNRKIGLLNYSISGG